MKRQLIAMFTAALAASMILSACGGKKEDPVNQITAAETFAETEESTEAEVVTEAETTTAAAMILPSDPPADAEEETFYHYEVFTDGQPHKVIFWTDGVTQKLLPFTSLNLPGWGIESISLPSDLLDSEQEVYVVGANDGTDERIKLAAEQKIIDDSYDYPGAWSRRSETDLFRIWRVEVDKGFDFANAYPEDIYNEIYPFRDLGSFYINLDVITKYQNPDGTVDYLLTVSNRGHWGNVEKKENGEYSLVEKKRYQGYILVRPRGDVAHCVCYATTDEDWEELGDYIFNSSAVLTDVKDITEGTVCKKESAAAK